MQRHLSTWQLGLGIVSGKEVNGNKVFDPRANATRGQASKVVYYLLEKLK